MEGSPRLRRIPSPLEALAWGSMSIRRDRLSANAMQEAKFTEVVVLPTPPFWLQMQITCPILENPQHIVSEFSRAPSYHKSKQTPTQFVEQAQAFSKTKQPPRFRNPAHVSG